MSAAFWSDYHVLRMLKLSPFQRRQRGGWRFGTRRISQAVVDRLTASGRAQILNDQLHPVRRSGDGSPSAALRIAEGTPAGAV